MTYEPSTSYSGAYSVEAWVKPGSAAKYYQTIFDTRGGNGEYSFDLVLEGLAYPGGQQLHIDVGDGQEWLTGSTGRNVPFAFAAGHWYYIVATVSPAQHVADLYVNGGDPLLRLDSWQPPLQRTSTGPSGRRPSTSTC
jgi:hypothetical protein